MVLNILSVSGSRKSKHPLSRASFYFYRLLPASPPAQNEPRSISKWKAPRLPYKKGNALSPNLQCPIYYSKETNNHLIHLFTNCYKRFLCACMHLHFKKTDKILQAGQPPMVVLWELFCSHIWVCCKTYEFESGLNTTCNGIYIILTFIGLKCHSYSYYK